MIILNYIVGALALLVGITSIFRIFGIMKPSRIFSAMRDRMGVPVGTIIYTIFYGLLPIAFGVYSIFLGINEVSFF